METALYLFPVPLNNDVSPELSLPEHNTQILREIRYFVVENLRSARRFLKKCDRNIDIDSLTFTELNEHTRPEAVAPMLAPLERGESIGVISEAGCPAVADPGADLVAVAQRKGLKVVPLVGPSSILLALMGSGFNGQSFAFNGYLPIRQPERAQKLKEMERRIIRERQTQIFIETPYRNNRLIAELAGAPDPSGHAAPPALSADRLLCVASDLTGPQESILTLPLSAWRKRSYNYDKIPTIFLLF